MVGRLSLSQRKGFPLGPGIGPLRMMLQNDNVLDFLGNAVNGSMCKGGVVRVKEMKHS